MHSIAVHGHFYQPPREDPWLGTVLKDPTAAPGHDWNERICKECYLPNAFSALHNQEGKIIFLMNNYEHFSFNFGPTLHEWIAQKAPQVDQAIREAQERTRKRHGSGSAIAQGYNHMILPLASERDKRTQVLWGIQDYRYRYGHAPEGMWLPETAVDTATLEALAGAGITFTILAPYQCAAVAPPGGAWQPTPGAQGLDTRRPYVVELPSGKDITVFFYDGPLSHGIAFGELLQDGVALGNKLKEQALGGDPQEPSILVVATDGETFGHHHHFSEMALSRAFQMLQKDASVDLLCPGAFLKQHPPRWKAQIVENTSWSCAHGVERWRSDCGCHTGGDPSWNQQWRAPLRKAFDELRQDMDAFFEKALRPFCDDPWKLRDESVALLLDTSPENFLQERLGNLPKETAATILTLLESQRMGMFVYTSCGWFFNDIAGVETIQNIRYAFRGAELLFQGGGPDLKSKLLENLSHVKGNEPLYGDAKILAEARVIPKMRSLREIAGAAYMMENPSYHSFTMKEKASQELPASGGAMAEITLEEPLTGRSWEGCAFRTNPSKGEFLVFTHPDFHLNELQGQLQKTPWKEWVGGTFPDPPSSWEILARDDKEELLARWDEKLLKPYIPLIEKHLDHHDNMLRAFLEEEPLLSPLLRAFAGEFLHHAGKAALEKGEIQGFLSMLQSSENSQKWIAFARIDTYIENHLRTLLEETNPPWDRLSHIMATLEESSLNYPKEPLRRLFWYHLKKVKSSEEPPFLKEVGTHLGFAPEGVQKE